MKSIIHGVSDKQVASLPVRGAWIEIMLRVLGVQTNVVAPRAGSVD